MPSTATGTRKSSHVTDAALAVAGTSPIDAVSRATADNRERDQRTTDNFRGSQRGTAVISRPLG
ncbi:hypothetical protein GCM10027184_38040 [Saccharothrix stipae]